MMEENKDHLLTIISEDKWKEEIKMLQEIIEREKIDEAKNNFKVVKGAVDKRDKKLLDMNLPSGFSNIQCGLRGSKLSGG